MINPADPLDVNPVDAAADGYLTALTTTQVGQLNAQTAAVLMQAPVNQALTLGAAEQSNVAAESNFTSQAGQLVKGAVARAVTTDFMTIIQGAAGNA